jgi:hypothetical protein
VQPAQHRYHRQVADAEIAVQPLLVAQCGGQIGEAGADILDHGRAACGRPRTIHLEDVDDRELHDRRLDRIERGDHPLLGARLPGGVGREQAGRLARDMQRDRAGFEDFDVGVRIGRQLSERLQTAVRWALHMLQVDDVDSVMLAGFFERPARPHIANIAARELGDPFEGGNRGGHGKSSSCSEARFGYAAVSAICSGPFAAAIGSIQNGPKPWPSGSVKAREYMKP